MQFRSSQQLEVQPLMNKPPNGKSTPRMKMAIERKILPDNTVPIPATTVEAIKLPATFLSEIIIA